MVYYFEEREVAMQIELEEGVAEVLARLRRQAKERSMPLASYLELFADNDKSPSHPAASIEEFDALLDEVSDGLPATPLLPDDFSRADIYTDHD